ncbi:MAG: hypothetical protein J7L11_02545 [Thermoprotei archaeon]|nr:hypothetical protein [Thermoprotei archaeon]
MGRGTTGDDAIKQMAQLLRSGATMLSQTCPVHGVPLFKLKTGDIICPVCRKRVVFVREGEEAKAMGIIALSELEKTVYEKIRFLTGLISSEEDPDRMYEPLRLIIACLEVLEKLKRLGTGA